MANKKRRIICPKCPLGGGTLTIRKAGRERIVEEKRWPSWQWYIGHYDPSKKNRRKWCYIGSYDREPLSKVRIADPRYDDYLAQIPVYAELYYKHKDFTFEVGLRKHGLPPWIEIEGYDDSKYEELRKSLETLLLDIGWPPRWIDHKLSADASHSMGDKSRGLPRRQSGVADRYRPMSH